MTSADYGIIPESLAKKEVAHHRLTELHVVHSRHERKFKMAELSDGFIALPGGVGTAEEILEAFTWSQLGIHVKTCGLLNIRGFFDGFITQLERMAEDRFLRVEQLDQLAIETEPDVLIQKLQSSKPMVIDKWIDREIR